MNENKKFGDVIKRSELAGMREFTSLTAVNYTTLRNWYTYKPILFDIVLSGAEMKKKNIKK